MDKLDKKFEKDILKASVNIRNEDKRERNIHIKDKATLDAYMNMPLNPKDDLWCPEFNECIGEVLEAGAKKYAPRDWEKPDGYSMGYKAQCDAIFHHSAREFVYKENQELIEKIQYILDDSCNVLGLMDQLLTALKYDELGTRHIQHAATRGVMSYTREKRGLK